MDQDNSKSNAISTKKNHNSEICSLLKNDDCNIQYGGTSKDNEIESVKDKNQSKCTRLYGILVTLTIEPIMFSFMFGYVMNMTVLSNMMMDKGCLYYFNYSSEICSNLSAFDDEKKNVEVLATNYSLYSNLLSILAAFLMIFIAPWSDKYGRRLPLLVSIMGALFTDVGYILCSIYFDSRLEYLVLSRLPSEVFGGFICVLMIIFSLASDQSSKENRTLKYTSVEIALGLGVSFGGITGGFLYQYYGYLYVYMMVAALHIFGCLWVLFILEETTGLNIDMKWHEKAKDFFVCRSFKDGLAVTCKPRTGNTRALLLSLMGSMCLIVINYEAFGTIAYVYVHHVFNWDPTMFSVVNTTYMFMSFVFTLMLVPVFIRVFNFNDFTLGIIGTVSMMAKNIFIAFSDHHIYLYYTGLCAGIFTSMSTLSVRTGISKLVEKDELARVFSFLATCEAMMPMIGSLVVTKVFEATMDIYPNVTYVMTFFWLIIPLITFIWALKSTRSTYYALNASANDHVKEKA